MDLVEAGRPIAEVAKALVVGDLQRARAFYHDVLGAEPYRDDGGTSAVLRFLGSMTHSRPGLPCGLRDAAGAGR